jgi:hypothetical protein
LKPVLAVDIRAPVHSWFFDALIARITEYSAFGTTQHGIRAASIVGRPRSEKLIRIVRIYLQRTRNFGRYRARQITDLAIKSERP